MTHHPPQRAPHYSLGQLRINIVCPLCMLFMGQCADEDTRTIALRTHAQHCTHTTKETQ
jgi:hypothetical protein